MLNLFLKDEALIRAFVAEIIICHDYINIKKLLPRNIVA